MNAIKNRSKVIIRRSWPIAMLIIFVVVLFYANYSSYLWNKNIIWRDINLQNINFKGSNNIYSISDGGLMVNGENRIIKFELSPFRLYENSKVIQLALFTTIEDEDSLFLDSTVSSGELKESVENISRVNEILKKEMILDETGLPIGFLNSLSSLSERKSIFGNEINSVNAQSLLRQYGNTNKEYSNNAKTLLSLLLKSNLNESYFAQSGAVTSKEIIVSDIRLIIKNSKTINNKIVSRSSCLNISPLFCHRSILEAEKESKVADPPVTVNQESIIKPADYPSIKDSGNLRFRGPYLVTSNCWLNEYSANNHLLYLVEDTATKFTKIRPEFANNIYYQKITPENRGPFLYKQFQKKNMEWEVISLNTPYACNDLRYYGDIATVDSFTTNYPKPLLYGTEEDSAVSKTVNNYAAVFEAEKNFYDSEIKSSANLLILGNKYKQLYSDIVAGLVVDNAVPALKDKVLDRSTLINGRLSQYPQMLNYQTYLLDMYSQTNGQRLREKSTDKQGYDSYFYLMHNFYALSFLSFSPLTIDVDSLKYIEKEESGMRSDVVNLNKIKEIITTVELDKINSINRNRIVNEISNYEIR